MNIKQVIEYYDCIFKKIQFLNTFVLTIYYAQGILPSKFHLIKTTIIIYDDFVHSFLNYPESKLSLPCVIVCQNVYGLPELAYFCHYLINSTILRKQQRENILCALLFRFYRHIFYIQEEFIGIVQYTYTDFLVK